MRWILCDKFKNKLAKKEALKPAELKNSTVGIFISETIATLEGTAIYRARWLYITILFQSATTVVSKWGGSNIGCWFNHVNHYHFENKGHCKSNISCQLCYDKGTAFLSILSAEWVECIKQAANWIDRNALRCNFSTSLLWLAKNAKKAEALFVPIHWNAFSSRLFWLD